MIMQANYVVLSWSAVCLLLLHATFAANTDWLNNCNGHGDFVPSTLTCTCYDGWGSDSDVSDAKDPTCALRVCPP